MSLLEGVRVLDLTRAWAGPLAGRMLGDLGAEVIHIEYTLARAAGVIGTKGYDLGSSPGWEWGDLPDPGVRAGVFPDADPGPDPWNRQGSFNKLNRNKKSICLDLHQTEGQQIFRDLVAVSDVVLENYSPRGARGLGAVFDVLRDVNPRIIVVSISGYGHTGPGHDRVALGPIIEAESGLAALTGYRGGAPTKFGGAMPDAIAGLNAAIGTITALAERDAGARGSTSTCRWWRRTPPSVGRRSSRRRISAPARPGGATGRPGGRPRASIRARGTTSGSSSPSARPPSGGGWSR
jgi:crotonobetainyl-CoA:carnitine CoA-transferase CaiB-like acyl-CoA transferase